MEMTNPGHLFVWKRDNYDYNSSRSAPLNPWSLASELRDATVCPNCRTELNTKHREVRPGGFSADPLGYEKSYGCPLCGWQFFGYTHHSEFYYDNFVVSALALEHVDAVSLALEDLGAHLRRKPDDAFYLSWRRFEELIADVFRHHGYYAVLTQPTRDEGADVVLLHSPSEKATAIVECKRYAPQRKVGVQLIRHLVGAAVDWGVRRAFLVTTGSYTSAAESKAATYLDRGYQVDLIAMADLVQMLGVYNNVLPPLDRLSEADRADLIQENLRQSEASGRTANHDGPADG